MLRGLRIFLCDDEREYDVSYALIIIIANVYAANLAGLLQTPLPDVDYTTRYLKLRIWRSLLQQQ
jgi:hypothetical protein